MVEIGLMPSDTGAAGGKMTGQNMTHYVIDGGRFQKLATAFIATGRFAVEWQSTMDTSRTQAGRTRKTVAAKKRASKTKYSCPCCEVNAWAPPSAALFREI